MHLYADVSEGLIKSERRIITEKHRKKLHRQNCLLICCYIRNRLSADVISPSALHLRTRRDKNHLVKSEI